MYMYALSKIASNCMYVIILNVCFLHSIKAHQDGSSITNGDTLNQMTVHYCNTRGVLLVNGRDTVCEGEGLIMARYHLGRRALECGRCTYNT